MLKAQLVETVPEAETTMANNADEDIRSSSWDGGIIFSDDVPDLRRVKCGLLTRKAALAAARSLPDFIAGLPKAELHLHIEGTFTPQHAYDIAKRNSLPNLEAFDPEAGARARGEFTSLVPFLIEYSKCSGALCVEQDFYDLCYAYLERAAANNVRHVEMFFDPQTHCFTDVSGLPVKDEPFFNPNGIGEKKLDFEVVIGGLHRACEDGRAKLGVDGRLIMCFLRDRSLEEALAVLQLALRHKDKIIGVGLDNAEWGFRPGKFKKAFDEARSAGLRCVAHAGEEGTADYVTEALDMLQVERVDHGVRCLEDPALVARLVELQTPLTVCPCSNHRLQVVPRFFMGENPVRQLMDRGLKVTLNSDDPAYFVMGQVDTLCKPCNSNSYDGFLSSNFLRTARDVGLTPDECVILARNSFESSWLTPTELQGFLEELEAYCKKWEI